MDCSPPGSSVHEDSPGKSTGVGCHALFQGILPTQGLNPGLPHCRRVLYHLSHLGGPWILEWVAYPFSRGFSWPRDWNGVSCIAGGFFINWPTREAQKCKSTEHVGRSFSNEARSRGMIIKWTLSFSKEWNHFSQPETQLMPITVNILTPIFFAFQTSMCRASLKPHTEKLYHTGLHTLYSQ